MSRGSAGLTVVFAAVRGTTSIRTFTDVRIVSGPLRMPGASSAASALPQDRIRILLSGAAFSGTLFVNNSGKSK